MFAEKNFIWGILLVAGMGSNGRQRPPLLEIVLILVGCVTARKRKPSLYFADMLRDTRISFEARIGRAQIVTDPGFVQVVPRGREDGVSVLDEIVGCASRQCLDGESRVCGTLRRKNAAIADKQIWSVVSPPELVDD